MYWDTTAVAKGVMLPSAETQPRRVLRNLLEFRHFMLRMVSFHIFWAPVSAFRYMRTHQLESHKREINTVFFFRDSALVICLHHAVFASLFFRGNGFNSPSPFLTMELNVVCLRLCQCPFLGMI